MRIIFIWISTIRPTTSIDFLRKPTTPRQPPKKTCDRMHQCKCVPQAHKNGNAALSTPAHANQYLHLAHFNWITAFARRCCPRHKWRPSHLALALSHATVLCNRLMHASCVSMALPNALLIFMDERQAANRRHTFPPPFCELAFRQRHVPLTVHVGSARA